ncbi:hypothetical protein NDU88_005247 [Pleurodeles waltl]|uniref:Uncharacterized protein n=1 Tax=Pleurodeles waltl TaxID=8319 RepID=A0AAV7WAI3_PLEWA|nr:hypothetical protein NDU88_005247 [Pleurodeles waltl]
MPGPSCPAEPCACVPLLTPWGLPLFRCRLSMAPTGPLLVLQGPHRAREAAATCHRFSAVAPPRPRISAARWQPPGSPQPPLCSSLPLGQGSGDCSSSRSTRLRAQAGRAH